MNGNGNHDAEKLLAVVRDSLDQEAGPEDWARQSYHSRTQFFRLFQALIEETPAAMRRRLRLERAAWHLANTPMQVTGIAFDAGYASLEAFSRAFQKAYRVSPTLFRRSGSHLIHLPAPNHFHFGAPAPQTKGAPSMDLFDYFAGTDSWYTRRMLEHAANASDEQLDRPLQFTGQTFGWNCADSSLREVLERMVMTKEVWVAALNAGPMPNTEGGPKEERTPAALLKRFERADAEFQKIFCNVNGRQAWTDTFVDTLCEQPETFTFGGMFAHVITFNTQRRMNALDAFQRLGMPMKGIGCPMEYEASLKGSGN